MANCNRKLTPFSQMANLTLLTKVPFDGYARFYQNSSGTTLTSEIPPGKLSNTFAIAVLTKTCRKLMTSVILASIIQNVSIYLHPHPKSINSSVISSAQCKTTTVDDEKRVLRLNDEFR